MQQLTKTAVRVAAVMFFSFLSVIPALAQSALDKARQAVSEGDYTTAARLYDDAVQSDPKNETVLTEAGDVNMELERYDKARDLYKRAYDQESRDPAINRKYALALSAVGDATAAVEAARRAMKYDDGSLSSTMVLGKVLIAAGKDSLNTAELTILTASKKFPDAAEPNVALGDLYFARGVYELAQSYYEKALTISPALVESRVKLGRTYRELAKRQPTIESANEYYNKALVEFNDVTARDPKNARAWLEQGEILMLAEEYEKAGQSFNQYVELRPEDPRGDIMLARAAYGGQFYTLAIDPLERILARTDSVSKEFAASARAMLAKAYLAAKEYAKARDMYSSVPDSLLSAEDHKYQVMSILSSGGDTLKALGILRSVMEQNPGDCSVGMELGRLSYNLKRYTDVVDVFTKRIASCPDEPTATPYLYIGLAEFAQEHYEPAIAALNKSIESDSDYVQSYYWLMNAYAKNKQLDKSVEIARALTGRQVDEKEYAKILATAHFFIGNDRFGTKDYQGAIKEFEKASQYDPENAQSYLFTAYSYQFLKDKDNACKFYRLALKYDPKNPDIRKNASALGCE